MTKRINHDYIKDIFKFDINKEKAIYSYLCDNKLNKQLKKLLDEDTKFDRYIDWKEYQVAKYNKYSKESLIEFARILNLCLRNINRFNIFTQIFCTSLTSAFLSNIISAYFDSIEKNALINIAWIILLPIMIAFLMVEIATIIWNEERYIPFYEDMKEIINELIEKK